MRAEGRADGHFAIAVRAAESATIQAQPGPPLPIPAPLPTAEAPAAESSRRSTQRLIGYALGGAGLVSAVVGTVFGAQAIQAKNDPRCTGSSCTPAGAQAQEDGIAAGNRATVAFVIAGALVAGGAVVWLTAPKKATRASASVALMPVPGGASIGLSGAW